MKMCRDKHLSTNGQKMILEARLVERETRESKSRWFVTTDPIGGDERILGQRDAGSLLLRRRRCGDA